MKQLLSVSASSQTLETTNVRSVSLDLAIPYFSYKRN